MQAGPLQDDDAAAVPWHVLIVDDSRDDAELAEIELRDAGLPVDCRRVWTACALREALAGFAPRVVLSDVSIPGFSGIEALAEVRAHDPSLPFVFMTGSLHAPDAEPLPVDALVVLKDDLAALPGMVRKLLAQA